jgi:hypothetical protein
MLPIAFVVLALIVLFREWILEQALRLSESGRLPKVDARQAVAAALLAAAAASWAWQPKADADPTPAPPAGPIVLAGKFVGEHAAEDAAAFASLCDELAGCIEWDETLADPRLTTGVAIDGLRVAAREARMKGVSIGERHPLVRQAVHEYLDQPDVLGPAGGPLTPDQRSKWKAALRTIARAAEAAVR